MSKLKSTKMFLWEDDETKELLKRERVLLKLTKKEKQVKQIDTEEVSIFLKKFKSSLTNGLNDQQ